MMVAPAAPALTLAADTRSVRPLDERSESVWEWIPQLHYDVIARVIPGAALIASALLLAGGPARLLQVAVGRSSEGNVGGFALVLLCLLASYLVGFILGELWEMTFAHAVRATEERMERECLSDKLAEHDAIQESIGNPPLGLLESDLPSPHAMCNHLRFAAPSEAARLLKLRAERRECHVLMLGLLILWLASAASFVREPRLLPGLMAVVIPGIIWILWSRSARLLRHFSRDTCTSWLVHASAGRFPAQWRGGAPDRVDPRE